MFGNLSFMLHQTGLPRGEPPKDVPPPTPINFPRCYPQVPDKDASDAQDQASMKPDKPLTSLLQSIVRPTEVSISHFEALGLHVVPDATLAQLLPDPAFIPDFEAWHALSPEEVHAINESTRKRLNSGNLSPGCQTYLDRRRELLIPNEMAYRTIRRMPPPKGQQQARLGNAYEFYRFLDLFSAFWDDTSRPQGARTTADQAGESNGEGQTPTAERGKATEDDTNAAAFFRTGAGHQMPVDYRQSIVTAFLKLVAYDFTCNVSAPRVEPRLYITSKPPTGSPRSSYFSSGCTFVFRSPNTREAARAGIVEGPIAAVSARHTTSFPPPDPTAPASKADRDSILDLGREVVAGLITAQHRAREGRTEKRIGENAWWCTKPRWGGGPGGPIGREIEMLSGADETIGDKDAPPPEGGLSPSSSKESAAMSLPQRPFSRPPGGGLPFPTGNSSIPASGGSGKGAKRLKKSGNLPMYDNYRMVRPPASTWDKRTRYEAIGRAKGVDYDDIFVVSTLLHHISILRLRVPDRLLAVLEGEVDDDSKGGKRSWGKLEVWRSPWFDFFKAEERVQAMQIVWSMLAWMMREQPPKDKEGGAAEDTAQQGRSDVKMTGA
ncbi:hypothetical protein MYCTH_70349 [Thermothelomyces thermophilus ATCC 42464]|uniref:Uncharacterized protein n=1 Tax=Thermothelomyces thermophilus (strain ATCC 42464 / BCRC 31852 / DSM 1799) TaxID=573729 RepID=G2QI33_THET4|nr:uncharacterized protein MYCTH_70349 [Thermothelomyces thermophilus ATCC 42464]AEO60222.1 hypothetical protein MYCTH_70349 [Thermothelomyces thermophilus ATCC 42464]